jgi:hypothetical protein
MTNNTRSRHLSLAALLLAGLSAACMSNPVAGESVADAGQPADAGDGADGVRTCPSGNPWCSGVGIATDFSVPASPQQEVDILFVIDNSPSMDPKQAALAANFPKMIEQLQKLPGGMPDVHIGVISSDMGAGAQRIGGNCNTVLGDRGLLWGNVPVDTSYWDPNTPMQQCYDNAPVRATVAPGSCWALAQNPPITDGCGLFSGARWIEDVQNPSGGERQRNYTGNLTDVFSCLATAVGVGGCGYEHQLQSLRVALNPQQLGCDAQGHNCSDGNMANVGFLRENAYLAIVLVTDEDDCSADPNNAANDNIFTDNPRDPNTNAPTETSSLRCAARGHVCNGSPIPNYTPAAGYTGTGFSARLADCAAKDQSLPGDNGLLPLIAVQDMITSVTQTKSRPMEQILVSGIIGWPANDDPTSAQYQIGKDSTAVMGQESLWDYLPVCALPSVMSADGNTYKAYSGLRLKKFIDAFGEHGQHFSICNSDFTGAMTQIGTAIGQTMTADCFPYPLMDGDPNTPGIQPECQAAERVPCDPPGSASCPQPGYAESSLQECEDGQGRPLDPASPPFASVSDDARPCWYLSYDTSAAGCPDAPKGQKISVLPTTGTAVPAGTQLALTCLTCPASNPECTVTTTNPSTGATGSTTGTNTP